MQVNNTIHWGVLHRLHIAVIDVSHSIHIVSCGTWAGTLPCFVLEVGVLVFMGWYKIETLSSPDHQYSWRDVTFACWLAAGSEKVKAEHTNHVSFICWDDDVYKAHRKIA
jgi:hypothetical protein